MVKKTTELMVKTVKEPEKNDGGLMTDVDNPRVPTQVVATGVVEETSITDPTGTSLTFTPNANKDFIVINTTTTGTVTATVVAKSNCDMGHLHDFVMAVTSISNAFTEKMFVIPQIDHYVDPATGLVTINFDSGMQANGSIGIFEMP